MVDPHSGKSRGFGFVTFDDSSVVEQVMLKRDHSIMGKTVEVCSRSPPVTPLPIPTFPDISTFPDALSRSD